MDDLKHTPGEWRYKDGMISSDETGGTLATMNETSKNGSEPGDGPLMAAAPELLEACEQALNVIYPDCPATIHAIEKLKAAIAKAKGQQ